MTDKSNWETRLCEPLLNRMDPLMRASSNESSIACEILNSSGSDQLRLDPPFFTRLTNDAGLPQNTKRLLTTELKTFGVAWLGDPIELREGNPGEYKSDTSRGARRISPIEIDQPIDVESLCDCSAIELQLFGLPFQTLPNSRRARWTPALPIDISKFEQLEKKIDVMRVIAGGKCPIGAAVGPGAVYEDLRFLIDSGFDFITLMVEVQHALLPTSNLRLAPLEPTLEQAIKAVQDSGSKAKILVSAALYDSLQMFRCLQLGVSAVSIDAFIASSKPKETVPTKETFGSVLSTYVPVTANAAWSWLTPAMNQLIESLQDCATYSGNLVP